VSERGWRRLHGYNVEFSIQDFSKKRKVWVLREHKPSAFSKSKEVLANWFVVKSKKGFEAGIESLNLFLEQNPQLRKFTSLRV
jgi:hypothetical protein